MSRGMGQGGYGMNGGYGGDYGGQGDRSYDQGYSPRGAQGRGGYGPDVRGIQAN